MSPLHAVAAAMQSHHEIGVVARLHELAPGPEGVVLAVAAPHHLEGARVLPVVVLVEEDRVVIEKLDPAIPSKESIGEFIVPADDIIMHYRAKLADWQRRGWRMDLETLAKNRGRVAYSIPSPARRRERGDWAVTPVPMLRS